MYFSVPTKFNQLDSEISSINTDLANCDSKIDRVGYFEAEFEQGNVSSTTGEKTASNAWVRTKDFIPIDCFVYAYKPATVGIYALLYGGADGVTYLDQHIDFGSSSAQTLTQAYIKSNYPSCKNILIRGQIRSAETTSVEQFTSAGGKAVVCWSTRYTYDISKEYTDNKPQFNQYINLQDIELSEGEYTYTLNLSDQKFKPMLVKCNSKYSGTNAPTIVFKKDWLNRTGSSYANYYGSPVYTMCNNIEFDEKAWRVVPHIYNSREKLTIKITVPEGSTLYIHNLWNEYETPNLKHSCGIRMNAHGPSGFCGPANVMDTFIMAHKLGYEACITIPKVTYDGIYVCLHNDNDIGDYVYYDDGTAVPDNVKNNPVSSFTYEQLLQFDFGVYRGYPFKGSRIPKLEDFLMLCAKTGMKPMFSVHPNLSGHWANIKSMAENIGVLSSLGIKSDPTNIEVPMQTLGDLVESYTIDFHAADNIETIISRFDGLKTTYGIINARCVLEAMEPEVWSDANILLAQNAGYELSVVSPDDISLVEGLIKKGVHEFTEDYNSSNGLNW